MKRVDWQAYLDGSLSAEEMRKAEELLATTPSAQRELAGLREFRSVLRNAAVAAPVPASLGSRLSEIARPAKPRLTRWAAVAVPAMAAAGAILFATVNSTDRLDRSPVLETIQSPTPVAAADWAKSHARFWTPVLDLSRDVDAQLVATQRGEDWVCYCYNVCGSVYHVTMNTGPRVHPAKEVRLANGQYATSGDEGLVWWQCGLNFYVRGSDPQVVARIAVAVMGQAHEQHKAKV